MNRKECPFCGEMIQIGALKCRYCREWLEEDAQPKIEQAEAILRQGVIAPSPAIKEVMEEIKEEIEKTQEVVPQIPNEEDIALDETIEIFMEEEKELEAIVIETIEPELPTENEDLDENQFQTIELQGEQTFSQELETTELSTKEEEKEDLEPILETKTSVSEIEDKKEDLIVFETKEEINFVPIEEDDQIINQPRPIQPVADETPTEPFSDQEAEEKVYLIKWQNFKSYRIVAFVTFLLYCVTGYYLYKDIQNELSLASMGVITITLGANAYLLAQLKHYLKNFEVSELTQKATKWLVGVYILSALCTLVFYYFYIYAQTIMIILPIVCIGLIAILRLIIGWELWQKTYDYVGGMAGFGALTLFSVLLPGLGVFTPLTLIRVFGDAQEHIDDFGCSEEDQEFY